MCLCVCADAHLLWKKLILRLEDSSGVEEDPSSVSCCCSRKTWEVGRTSDNISVTFLYLKCDAFAYTASHEKLLNSSGLTNASHLSEELDTNVVSTMWR